MKQKLTKEKALELHRQMWEDMQKELGDWPYWYDRVDYKHNWCSEHGYDSVTCWCFLCEYDAQHNKSERCNCLIKWPDGKCTIKDFCYNAPISEILALPERKAED